MTQPEVDLSRAGDLPDAVAHAVRSLAVAGFHALWAGGSPAPSELVKGDPGVLREAVDHLLGLGRLELSGDGCLLAVHGLTRRPTPHRIEHAGGAIHTWCALDAIGIPAALALDATALTRCPTCSHQLAVTLRGGQPAPLPEAVLWYPVADSHHLIDDFCSGANLFCCLDHLRSRVDPTGAGDVMTVEEVAMAGRGIWEDVS